MQQINNMAQQDKTDFYWNGVLSGAVNNLYYDLINVDVCHVPYATNHRNSSFFLKTRLAYQISDSWANWAGTNGWEITDVKILRDEKCDNVSWDVYALWKHWNVKAIFAASLRNWCVGAFNKCRDTLEDKDEYTQQGCGDWKLFTTDFVKWNAHFKRDTVDESYWVLEEIDWTTATEVEGEATWIQINKYTLWTTVGLFSDENVENHFAQFSWNWPKPWMYLLVYRSANWDGDGFSWQVRMVTDIDNNWRVVLDAPWQWFKVIDTSDFTSTQEKIQEGRHVKYAFFQERGEVVWFTDNKDIRIFYYPGDCRNISVYNQDNWDSTGSAKSNIIWVASANDKIFVLTDNGYIHYTNTSWGYNKFFIQEDMFAGVDKIALTAYRDMILAFWRNHIALWVPDEQNRYRTMYNQSTTIGLRNRYSFAEYEWDLVFVSNDKRLLALGVSSTWRYGLSFEDIWDRLNWKLSALIPWDEVYVWSDENNLRVFVNSRVEPYDNNSYYWWRADIRTWDNNTGTHIYKFDTLFKVWTEDHIIWSLIRWASEGIYFWQDGIYIRNNAEADAGSHEFKTRINAFMIENESNWLDNHPLLFQLAKLNRLITTLWPWVYSNTSKIRITNYTKGIWYTYEFPINGDWNLWVWLMTDYYNEQSLSSDEQEKLECILSTLQDWQKKYQPNCPDEDVQRQYIVQTQPWCDNYTEMLTESHWVCINDKLYELAPTMPLVTSLWENQTYSTQIKIELIWGKWDIITFGWWLAELYLAPLWLTWPDWEYQLQPQTDC